ncbi:MAG: hypothetical protein RRY97_08345, partial [Oscillibacter sp.]
TSREGIKSVGIPIATRGGFVHYVKNPEKNAAFVFIPQTNIRHRASAAPGGLWETSERLRKMLQFHAQSG